MMRVRLAGVALGVVLLAPAGSAKNQHSDDSVLEFKRMVGVSGPYLGTTNPIQGVSGAGAAWKVAEARGELKADGKLEVMVRGLVLVSTSANPVANFRAAVSCRLIDGTNAAAIVIVSTGDFPASTTGDADIEETLDLPDTCFAPIVFVTSSTGRWFAVSGF